MPEINFSVSILFLHPNSPDYAGDGLLHGLRQLLGDNCIDYPRADYMYDDYPLEKWNGVANEGKVLYGLLEDTDSLQHQRLECLHRVDEYTCIAISNPSAFGPALQELFGRINIQKHREKIAWVDGSDTNRCFPFASLGNLVFKYPRLLFSPVKYGRYFKREFAGFAQAAPGILNYACRKYKVYPLGISIPEKHIIKPGDTNKTKLFPSYIVDEELAQKMNATHGLLGMRRFVFSTESEYWNDIDQSRYGPTTKRAGWDALRHYEYAARGAVLCFKDLDAKPAGCAPHGLIKENCLVYKNDKELFDKIETISETAYKMLQQATLQWISEHTTIAEARRFLDIILTVPNN